MSYYPPDHLTRFDKMIEESNGESMVQIGIQGIFYLFFVKESVRAYGPGAPTSITFSDIKFSILIGLLSLAVGKFKVASVPLKRMSTIPKKGGLLTKYLIQYWKIPLNLSLHNPTTRMRNSCCCCSCTLRHKNQGHFSNTEKWS